LTYNGFHLPWTEEEGGPDHWDRGDGGDPDDEEFEEEAEEESPTSTTSYGSSRTRSTRRAGGLQPNPEARHLARDYVKCVANLGEGTVSDWASVLQCGDELLTAAGGVEEAARLLWDARKEAKLDNLRGVRDETLDGVLHPLVLEYLRAVECNGMVARHPGSKARVEAGLHPNAKNNLDQVYKQIFKDVRKHRVLVVKRGNQRLGTTVSSPFEAVDKMLPDRSIAPDKRIVHDQRQVNSQTDKLWHPPALQPTHQQIARRILWHKTRFPGLDVLISKRDIAGAFRLLWVAPGDAHLFAGDLPWNVKKMAEEEGANGGQHDGEDMTVIYLVSSFGFSGSPGRATEDYHRAHRPARPRRDGACSFDSKVLVDDCVLVEPAVGLRPWVSASCYDGVKLMLGSAAVNEEKNLVEGVFRHEQTVWGLTMNSKTELASLPARRIEKGAHLLAHHAFDYDMVCLTLRQLQQFRGITTGWSVVVKGLKNELKAADVFLTGGDGSLPVKPKVSSYLDETMATTRAWEDLWALFEMCRWLCAQPEMWESQFCATLDELLDPRERLALPRGHRHAVFVSADATETVVGAIDWTNGQVARLSTDQVGPWLEEALKGEMEDEKVRIHVSEMLAFVAFAIQPWGSHGMARWSSTPGTIKSCGRGSRRDRVGLVLGDCFCGCLLCAR